MDGLFDGRDAGTSVPVDRVPLPKTSRNPPPMDRVLPEEVEPLPVPVVRGGFNLGFTGLFCVVD